MFIVYPQIQNCRWLVLHIFRLAACMNGWDGLDIEEFIGICVVNVAG
jgi:hypothetical protein